MMSVHSYETDINGWKKWHAFVIRRLMRHSCDRALKAKIKHSGVNSLRLKSHQTLVLLYLPHLSKYWMKKLSKSLLITYMYHVMHQITSSLDCKQNESVTLILWIVIRWPPFWQPTLNDTPFWKYEQENERNLDFPRTWHAFWTKMWMLQYKIVSLWISNDPHFQNISTPKEL